MIEIKGLSKNFGTHIVLKDISLTVKDKTILGLIGINGAGKSTLLRCISGIYSPDSGIVMIDGMKAFDNEEVKKDMFFLPDDPYYSTRTTPSDLMKLLETFYKIDELVYFKMLDQFQIPVHKRMDKFSKGMKRQVFVALAFGIRPKYLLLDEAFDGLDPLARELFKAEIKRLVEECGSTVIISSHSLRDLEGMCDSFAILNNNQIQATGTLEDACNGLHKYQIAFIHI